MTQKVQKIKYKNVADYAIIIRRIEIFDKIGYNVLVIY